MTLFPHIIPPRREGIDLRHCDTEEMLHDPELFGSADLIVADPPWAYGTPSHMHPTEHYGDLHIDMIGYHLRLAAAVARSGRRMLLWVTMPLLAEAMEAVPLQWEYVTAGAWGKDDDDLAKHHGPGWHWAGCSELALVYRASGGGTAHRNTKVPLKNHHVSAPTEHSEKPVDWQEMMIRKWVPPGGRVVDLYAGRGSVARAVIRAGEGRTYVGAEIDADRHLGALGLIAQERTA